MPLESFAARYRAAERLAGGRCPIEAGLICRLADHECRHGRLASTTPPPAAAGRRKGLSRDRWAGPGSGPSAHRTSQSPRRTSAPAAFASRPERLGFRYGAARCCTSTSRRVPFIRTRSALPQGIRLGERRSLSVARSRPRRPQAVG
jgi:hypothetical protein